MMTLPGILVPFVGFALAIGWIGKAAQGQGRSPMAWAGLAAIVGIAGFAAGTGLIAIAFDVGKDVSLVVTLFAILSPMFLMLAPMIAIGIAVQRGGFARSGKNEWTVHILQHGEGTLRIDPDRVVLAWSDGSRDVARHEVKHVEADGECVRVQMTGVANDDSHYALLPVANGMSPAGRRDLSRQIAQRLVRR
jgi:hypothetical protein